jgi:HK97 family phage major capsid protein
VPQASPNTNQPPNNTEWRTHVVTRASVNAETRTVEIAFASETPYERWWGTEILDCTRNSVRAQRLTNGANLLCEHNARDVVGVVESFSIDNDRVCRAVVRFGKSERANEVFVDVQDGIRQNISVGYLIHEAVLVGTKDGRETYRVTDWEPLEVSLVSIPADPTVGVGRSLPTAVARALEALPPNPNQPNQTEQPVKKAYMPEIKTITPDAAPAQRNHAAEIAAAATAMPGGADLAMRSIQAGHTVDQFMAEAVRHFASQPLPTADIGLTKKEAKRYSILAVARALDKPGSGAGAFERECSDAVGKKLGREARGFFMPNEVSQLQRDLVAGTPTAGGNLVATNLLSGSFIDILRNAMVLPQLGVRMLTGLTGNVAIPKQTGSATVYWVAEGVAPAESQQAIGQVTMSPKTIGGFTDVSRTLLNQSSIDVENFILSDLAANVGLGIQQAVITGDTAAVAAQFDGLIKLIQAGGTVAGGTNGLAPTWANIVALETLVAASNAESANMAYLTNTKVRGALKTTQKFASTNGMPVWDTSAQPLNGYQAAITNAVPSNLVKGASGAVCSAILFGNFNDVILGMWGATDIIRDPYAMSSSGGVRIVALQDCDMKLRNLESFSKMVDALTA